MTTLPPVAPAPFDRRSLRVVTWIAQAFVALALAFGAALVAPRIAQVLLIGAAAGVLAASAVGLVVWTDDRDSPGRSDRPV
ncbi:MAG TPA: hypothetical protein VFP39_10515 [Gemmatimonadales bacterium]|nr:hypothetical protein [Gemmatimonadales bacterium]